MFVGYNLSVWWCNDHLEKYEFVNGKDDIPYMKWRIKFMFERNHQPVIVRVRTTIFSSKIYDFCSLQDPRTPPPSLPGSLSRACHTSRKCGEKQMGKMFILP
jgi:hypothetical protein